MVDTNTDFSIDMRRLQEMDPFDLHSMLQGVQGMLGSRYFPSEGKSALTDRVDRLFRNFTGLTDMPDMVKWEVDARQLLEDVAAKMPAATKDLAPLKAFYTSGKVNHHFNNYQYCEKPRGVATTKADMIRQDINNAQTAEEFEAIIQGMQAMTLPGNVKHILDARLAEVQKSLDANGGLEKALGDDTTAVHGLPGGYREMSRELLAVCRAMEMDPYVPETIATEKGGYAETRKATLEARMDTREGKIDDLAQRVADIQNIRDRMRKEGSKAFGDSREYHHMQMSVESVCKLAENMDYSDPQKIRQLESAMEALQMDAQQYAQKKGGSTKLTSTGVSRKNMAMTLLELTTPGGTGTMFHTPDLHGKIVAEPSDKRRSLMDRKGSKRTIDQLIAEEKAANKEKYGHTKAAIPKRVHHVEKKRVNVIDK